VPISKILLGVPDLRGNAGAIGAVLDVFESGFRLGGGKFAIE
jgi:hypothetical protein